MRTRTVSVFLRQGRIGDYSLLHLSTCIGPSSLTLSEGGDPILEQYRFGPWWCSLFYLNLCSSFLSIGLAGAEQAFCLWHCLGVSRPPSLWFCLFFSSYRLLFPTSQHPKLHRTILIPSWASLWENVSSVFPPGSLCIGEQACQAQQSYMCPAPLWGQEDSHETCSNSPME